MKPIHYILIGLFLFSTGIILGRCSKKLVIPEPVIKYIELPPIEVQKAADEIKPISERLTAPLSTADKRTTSTDIKQYSEDKAAIRTDFDSTALVATVVDWNTERIYEETLIDSDTLGKATLRATVQYNKLTWYDFNYTPLQRTETSYIKAKHTLGSYGIANVTNRNTAIGIGARYGSFGIHVLGGYDYLAKVPIYGVGVMILF